MLPTVGLHECLSQHLLMRSPPSFGHSLSATLLPRRCLRSLFSHPSTFFSFPQVARFTLSRRPLPLFLYHTPLTVYSLPSNGSRSIGDRSHPVDRFNLGIAIHPYRPTTSPQTRPVTRCESIALRFVSCIGQPFIFYLPLLGTLLRRALTTQPPRSDVTAIGHDSISRRQSTFVHFGYYSRA